MLHLHIATSACPSGSAVSSTNVCLEISGEKFTKKKHYNPNVQIRGTSYVETYVITLSASSLFATPAVDPFISA